MRLVGTMLRSWICAPSVAVFLQSLIGARTQELTRSPQQLAGKRASGAQFPAHSWGLQEGGFGELVVALRSALGAQAEDEREQVRNRFVQLDGNELADLACSVERPTQHRLVHDRHTGAFCLGADAL